jgi:hypothetical protein
MQCSLSGVRRHGNLPGSSFGPHIAIDRGVDSTLICLLLLLALCCGLMSACTAPEPTRTPTVAPALTAVSPDTWQTLAPGIETRVLPGQGFLSQIRTLRLDPAYNRFRAQYRPGDPLSTQDWRTALPEARIIVNGGFFDPAGNALGLVVVDGQTFGRPFADRGGTFLVRDGQPLVIASPMTDLTGALEQAIQGFPTLIRDRQAVYAGQGSDRVSRRTVIGQDSAGRILIFVTPLLGMSLSDLSTYLAGTELDLVHAINLDGGGSSMLVYHVPDSAPVVLPAIDPIPLVLAAYPRPNAGQ